MSRTEQDEQLQNENESLKKVLREEREALECWSKFKSLPLDILRGIEISISKIDNALKP